MNPARLVQSVGWMAFLGLLLLGGGYLHYIASWQRWVLIAATAVFAALVLIDALVNRAGAAHDHHGHDHGTPADQWVQTLVHLLPLFLFVTMGVTTLGSQPIVDLSRPAPTPVLTGRHGAEGGPAATAIRTAAPDTTPTGPAVPAGKEPTPASGAPTTSANPEPVPSAALVLDGPTPAEPFAATNPARDPALPTAAALPLIELYYPKKHPGVKRIETIGRLMIPTAEELAKAPPEIDRGDLKLLLYRYVMTCCAADAAPVFVVLRGHDAAGLKVDEWVKISGTWIPAPGLGDMAKIEVDSLTIIEQPKEPFLQAPKE